MRLLNLRQQPQDTKGAESSDAGQRPSETALFSFPGNQSGYSLIELITVLVIIGIVSVSAVTRFSGSDGFAEFTYQNRLISALRNIQQRAMNDTRAGICYRINIVSGASTPAFGPPSLNFALSNAAATCGTGIDSSVDFLATTGNEIAAERISISATDSGSSSLTYIQFSAMGMPLTNLNNCAADCQVDFVGSSTASVCITSQGYIHAC